MPGHVDHFLEVRAFDHRLCSAAQQTHSASSAPRENPVPELPEVETTRRGIAPALGGKRVVAVNVYDRRLRWPVPAGLEQALEGRALVGVDRRSKYLLFRLAGPRGTDTLLVHLATGSLRAQARAGACRTTTSTSSSTASSRSATGDPRRFGTMLWIAATRRPAPLIAASASSRSRRPSTRTCWHRGTAAGAWRSSSR
jgi:formamidopyrimidine-DNA glycosylase